MNMTMAAMKKIRKTVVVVILRKIILIMSPKNKRECLKLN
jgi:hypothetical protein